MQTAAVAEPQSAPRAPRAPDAPYEPGKHGRRLAEAIGRSLAVRGGAAGIWWPGVMVNSRHQADHPLVGPEASRLCHWAAPNGVTELATVSIHDEQCPCETAPCHRATRVEQ
jgi:hypothetical protein